MAEAVLEIVLANLNSLIMKEFGLFFGFKQDLESLKSLLTTIKATLQDAEERQFSDNAIKDWLQKLKDAACVLDDIFDECATQALEFENEGLTCGLPYKHVVFRYKTAKKMKRIRERFDEIAAERSKFHLQVGEKKSEVLNWRQTTSNISEPQIYGRDEAQDKIVDILVGHAAGFEHLSVYPIVGLGGLGKTTLAQLIYNHEKVVNHFELRMWVCVSQDFSLERMIKCILESATREPCKDFDRLEPLQNKLIGFIQRKRFLLVLDDVWDEKVDNWQRLRSVLDCGEKGSSILVTTRLSKVAEIMGTITPPHDISKLSDKDCLELFKQHAFRPEEEQRKELVDIGIEILKKCGGVPLAAKALGGLLHFKRDEKDWLYVKESKLWNLQDEDYVMPALRLSYLNLPVKWRQCFAFCAIFPKDETIEKEYLIELWMANGFISSTELLDWEHIGNEVCNELYWRSFFQDVETNRFGQIKYFKMHDLVHDLAQSVAEEVCCIVGENGMPQISKRIRHLSNWSKEKVKSIWWHNFKSLKTCIINWANADDNECFAPLKIYSLRILELENIKQKRVPSSIGHLKYLRYLNLCDGWFETLPESICKLWNLQILKLDSCSNLRKLPKNLVRLKALQHLSLTDCFELSSLPPHIGKLTSLRTLSTFIVGKKRGLHLAELGNLNLKGVLRIKHLERVKSVTDAKEANMFNKHLTGLRLFWERNEESLLQENVEQIIEVLQPNTQHLQILEVDGYKGSHFPQWMCDPNFLKKIECLYLRNLPNVAYVPDSIGNLSSIRLVDITNCPKLTSNEEFKKQFEKKTGTKISHIEENIIE